MILVLAVGMLLGGSGSTLALITAAVLVCSRRGWSAPVSRCAPDELGGLLGMAWVTTGSIRRSEPP